MENFITQRISRIFICAAIGAASSLFISCRTVNKSVSDLPEVAKRALYDTSSVYYANYSNYPKERRSLPVGVFDSGTGGLTVLEAILALDEHNNVTGESGPDGIPDFEKESFTYLADQANMPYGNYHSEGKGDYLKELIVKDALFLTTGENKSKVIVVACNTATAYGLDIVNTMFEEGGTGLKAIGVINVASKAAIESVAEDGDIAIGVLATVGTIASGGYERTIRDLSEDYEEINSVEVFNQGGAGFAEAVDSDPGYLDRKAVGIRSSYRGPKLGTDSLSIKEDLLKVYNFDTVSSALLTSRVSGKLNEVQLNSPGNYARFHLVSLMEKIRKSGKKVKLGAIILGCSHYPYYIDTLEKCLKELINYKINGEYPYKDLVSNNFHFIDPSIFVARELYDYLKENSLLSGSLNTNKVTPYISVPADNVPSSALDSEGWFKYEFKYGRKTGDEGQNVKILTFSSKNINSDNLNRIKNRLPLSYSFIKQFTN